MKKPSVRLTSDDYDIVTFVARYRVATAAQLARMTGRSVKALKNRLPALERAGVLTSFFAPDNGPKLYTATADGLLYANMDLPGGGNVSWGLLRHYLHLTDVGVAMESAGEIVLTEREIRATSLRHEYVGARAVDGATYQAAATPRMQTALEAAPAYSPGTQVADIVTDGYVIPAVGSNSIHIPDMVLLRQPYDDGRSGNIAVEMELTRKSFKRWTEIIRAYVASPIFATVVYYVTEKSMKRGLEHVIGDVAGAEGKVFVNMFEPVDMAWDPAGRRAA